jgi:uncharacterized glyoxalase superfamily protein PhnB
VAEQRVIPLLTYEDAGRAADWIGKAFGFEETGRWSDDQGRVTHVNMELDGGVVMLGFASPDYQNPKHHAEVCEHARKWSATPYVVDGVLVNVDDIAAHFERAKGAGAKILSELEDNPGVGQRQYRAEDVEGHRWMFAERNN